MSRSAKNEARIKEQKAIALRNAGMTFDQIDEELGYGKRTGGSHKAFTRAIQRAVQSDVAELRVRQQLRLDELHRRLSVLLNSSKADVKEVVTLVQACLKIYERESKLLGLDAPQVVEHLGALVTDPKVEALAILDGLITSKEADAFAAGADAQKSLTMDDQDISEEISL